MDAVPILLTAAAVYNFIVNPIVGSKLRTYISKMSDEEFLEFRDSKKMKALQLIVSPLPYLIKEQENDIRAIDLMIREKREKLPYEEVSKLLKKYER